MKITGIIAEYNPFHNGHKFHIEKTKQLTESFVVVLMSGSLVQRGEFAMFSKHARANAALLNGADLVLELPAIYSSASAQRFAQGAIEIFDNLNVVDYLSFGSECGDLKQLNKTVHYIDKLDKTGLFATTMKSGVSYPVARQQALSNLIGIDADVFENPNDTLAIEYLSAIKKLSSKISPVVIKREGVEHDSEDASEVFASASYIRNCLETSVDIEDYLPQSAKNLFCDELISKKYKIDKFKFDIASLYALKRLNKEDFIMLPDVSEGLENRLYNAAQQSNSIEEFLKLVKTKRYTLARLRRIVIYALAGIKKSDQLLHPSYIRVLGMNSNGKKILALAKNRAKIPFYTSFSKIEKIGGRISQIDKTATDMHNYLSVCPNPGGRDYYDNAIII